MQLFSATYFIFLIAIFFLYWPIARRRAWALGLLLFANYFFYARWHWVFLLLIPAASSIDFLIGLGLQDPEEGEPRSPAVRKALVTASIVMNLGLLASLKYVPFFEQNWSDVTGWLGLGFLNVAMPAWKWALPLSLSFYVFQSLTYTIDLYRRDASGTRSYLAHLTAVSFFPTVIAGPITRVTSLITQLEKRKPLDPAVGGRALFLIGMGLTKKLMIADYLGANLIDRVFDFPNLYSGTEVLFSVYGYSLQLYYDFSGYTDIAIGSALLLGIQLPANFNRPYAAQNIADFWRRWHITLSNWLRDYLYFSLPGKRGKVLPYLNLFITMVIGGLWHGAGWTFIVWGALHGAGLVVVRLWQEFWKSHGARAAIRAEAKANLSHTAPVAKSQPTLSLTAAIAAVEANEAATAEPVAPVQDESPLDASPLDASPLDASVAGPRRIHAKNVTHVKLKRSRSRRKKSGRTAEPQEMETPGLEARELVATAPVAEPTPIPAPIAPPQPVIPVSEPPSWWEPATRFVSAFVTFQFVAFAWIFFRSADLDTAWTILARIASGSVSFANITGALWMVAGIALVAHYLPKKWYEVSLSLYMRAPFYAQAASLAALVVGLQYVVRTGAAPFIYNQF